MYVILSSHITIRCIHTHEAYIYIYIYIYRASEKNRLVIEAGWSRKLAYLCIYACVHVCETVLLTYACTQAHKMYTNICIWQYEHVIRFENLAEDSERVLKVYVCVYVCSFVCMCMRV